MTSTPSRVSSIPRPPPSPLRTTSGTSESTQAILNATGSSSTATVGLIAPKRQTSTPPPAQKTRARDLLRKHYGLGVGPPPPRPGNTQDPMDLNSPAFDAKSYYEQLITTSSLPALLKRENELLSEIRQLDSERQSLVYNHHHELIAASDTISAMKTRAESLDGDLDLLRAAFSEISRLTAEVSTEARDTT
ncbi:Vps51/Vps67-domain-containing protein [Pholiota molesta]|nr:Vps51/Vps67-domain-containing protein [Pholiota molesta]